jgi:hypothetical protein
MKAILIDPFARSVEYIESELTTPEVYQIVGEPALDFCRPFPGHPFEVAIVGDHSALQMPPLPRFFVDGFIEPIYGKTLVYGVTVDGKDQPTGLTIEEVRNWIEFE